jgi:hypothetical protein
MCPDFRTRPTAQPFEVLRSHCRYYLHSNMISSPTFASLPALRFLCALSETVYASKRR